MHHEHQELGWDSFEGAWATSWQCLCPISLSARISRQPEARIMSIRSSVAIYSRVPGPLPPQLRFGVTHH